jgi:hypothetical protein
MQGRKQQTTLSSGKFIENLKETRGVSLCIFVSIYSKKYLKAKIMKIQIFHNVKIQSSKTSSKINKNQNLSRYHNSIITNLKFQHKPKYHLSKIFNKTYHPHTIFKNPHIKIDLLLLPRGQNPLSYYTL